jgi:hypothetical protein
VINPCLTVGGWHKLEGLLANLRDKNNGQFENYSSDTYEKQRSNGSIIFGAVQDNELKNSQPKCTRNFLYVVAVAITQALPRRGNIPVDYNEMTKRHSMRTLNAKLLAINIGQREFLIVVPHDTIYPILATFEALKPATYPFHLQMEPQRSQLSKEPLIVTSPLMKDKDPSLA